MYFKLTVCTNSKSVEINEARQMFWWHRATEKCGNEEGAAEGPVLHQVFFIFM